MKKIESGEFHHELGVGEVLSGLMKRIDKSATTYSVQNATDVRETAIVLDHLPE